MSLILGILAGAMNNFEVYLVLPIGTLLGGGFKYVLFSPLLGEDSHFD